MEQRKYIKTTGNVIACASAIGSINACKAISGVSKIPLIEKNNYSIAKGILTFDLTKINNFTKRESSAKLKFEIKNELQKILIAKTGDNGYLVFTNKFQ